MRGKFLTFGSYHINMVLMVRSRRISYRDHGEETLAEIGRSYNRRGGTISRLTERSDNIMIEKDTVFILGAGASCHYGYPTGESLIEQIVKMANKLSAYCGFRLKSGQVVQSIPDYAAAKCGSKSETKGAIAAWNAVIEECEELVKRIETVRPLVIDYFLAWNEKLRPIGKLMIAAVILECETKSLLKEHRWSDWYRFLVHKIASNCNSSADILKNNVHFVTFNYDVSLEYHLWRSLSSIELFKPSDIT